jgi:hypothetical protein
MTGLSCSAVQLYAPESWSFDFGGQAGFNVQCPWRIVDSKGIRLTGSDHNQKFGLPKPVDAQEVALELLSKHTVERVSITELTADVVVEFDGGTRLEIFNNSAGYEGWNCVLKSGLQAIGMGGGTTAWTGT